MNPQNHPLILPILIYTLYILFIYFLMFIVRFKSVKSGKTSIKYFKSYSTNEVDPYVLVVGRHLENQYELPMIFFILNILTIILGFIDFTFIVLAWAFIASRFLHSYVHLTSNRIQIRMQFFTIGLIALIFQSVFLFYKILF